MSMQNVLFNQYNAMEFLASEMELCNEHDAEFKIKLAAGDKLVETDEGLNLVRNGIWFTQIEKMSTFKTVSFICDGHKIKLKLHKK